MEREYRNGNNSITFLRKFRVWKSFEENINILGPPSIYPVGRGLPSEWKKNSSDLSPEKAFLFRLYGMRIKKYIYSVPAGFIAWKMPSIYIDLPSPEAPVFRILQRIPYLLAFSVFEFPALFYLLNSILPSSSHPALLLRTKTLQRVTHQ